MKTFNDYTTENNFIQDLVEYSLHDGKYGVGTKAVLKSTKVSTMSKELDMSLDGGAIFTKIAPDDDAKEIWIGKGEGNEVYVEVNGKKFKLLGSGSTIGSTFNGYNDGTGISWKADSIETAQCLGLYIDANSALAKMGAAEGGVPTKGVSDSIKKKILGAFGNGEDWDGGGIGKITEKLDKINLGDMNLLLGLAAGMQEFWEKIGTPALGTAHIIHGRIRDYYNAEEGNPSAAIRGSKENTADIIISNVKAAKVIDGMGSGLVDYDASTGVCYIKDSNIKFLQVSLKKARGGAQLGKITGMLQAKYKLPKYEVMLSTLLEQGQLDELFGINLKAVTTFFKDVWAKVKQVVNKIKNWGRALAKSFEQKFKKQVKDDLKGLQKQLDRVGPSVNLKECFVYDKNGLICEGLNQELTKLNVNQLDVVRKGIYDRLRAFESSGSANPEFAYRKTGTLSGGDINVEDRYKLFSNYTGIYVFNSVISANKGDMSKLKAEMIALQKEMLFGKTTLPVYKVYGVGSKGGDTWEYLGGAKEFEAGKVGKFSGMIGAIIGFHANTQGTYYALESSFLYDIDPDDSSAVYTLNRMGTNAGGDRFSFVFEGSSTIGADKFLKKYVD